jgi:hypothetical protein
LKEKASEIAKEVKSALDERRFSRKNSFDEIRLEQKNADDYKQPLLSLN